MISNLEQGETIGKIKVIPDFSLNSHELILSLAGKLKHSKNFSGNPLDLQNNLRDEWKN